MDFPHRRTWADGRRKAALQRRTSSRWWWCVLWSVLCLAWSGAVADGVVVASYSTPNDTIQHMAIDPMSGRIYVGATNWLFQFDAGLRLERTVQTGPVEDNIQCFPGACSEQDLAPSDNVNKLLVVDEGSRRLLVCGSVYQGACRRRELDDITRAEDLVPLPVAANDETSSTIAFVGPARYMGYPSRVLYVATTNSRLGPYRDMVPAICSRSLEDGRRLFAVIEKSFSAISRVDISSQLRDYYLVDYIYGFHSGDYVYFATLQRRSHLRSLEEWGYISRLARVCVSDAGYNSYVETTLQCLGPDGRDYNLLQDAHLVRAEPADLLVGVFAASRDHTARSSGRSAVCVFSLADVEQRFTENIHLCYNGSVPSRDMDYIAGSIQACPEPGGGNIFNFCGESLKLNGSLPITSFPVITYENVTLSSVVATTTSRHTVAFIGTRSGFLKKVLIADEAEEFEEVAVDEGNPILPDMHLDPSENHVYAASPYKISKVRVEQCSRYDACDQCLRARNPYCGWCSLEKRCTVKAACQNATLTTDSSSPRWLSLNTQQCIDFQAIRPEHLPRNSLSVVELVINQLPQLPYGAHYMCVFGRSTPVQAKVTDQGLACLAPVLAERPPIPTGKDHVSVDLAVRSSETNKDFLNRLFAFYDCSVHKKCTACVTSAWACSWCPHENKCTHNVTTCSRTVISGENNPQNSLIKGRQHCPSFKLEEEILLPSGIPKEITIEVRNLPSVVENFQCVIEIEAAKERVLAIAKNNKIICSETAYTYQAEVGKVTATLTVLWNDDTYIDHTNVTLYKCPLLGSHNGRADCSLCLTRDRKYQCAWCDGSCKFGDACLDPVATTCPPPRIDYIHPLSGPIEGGTLVTIEGSNLGTSEDEIRDNITIGGIPCTLEGYSVSVKAVCRTGSSAGPMAAEVLVGNKAGLTQARERFFYKVVELSRVHPNKGPQSGGTRLYLIGTNLNVGSNLRVMLDELPCEVDRTLASNSQISCLTTRSRLPSYNVSMLRLFVDHALLTLPNPFAYRDDPVVKKITPLKSFVSGGRAVTVSGVNFLPVQQPRMVVSNNGSLVNETVCEVRSDHLMVCPSPSVSGSTSKWQLMTDYMAEESADHLLRLRIGFIMDGVESVRSLQDSFPSLHSDLTYVTDPKFLSFDGVKLYKGESLVIEGENLRLASTESEVNVTIGTKPCNLTSLASTQLVCLPPEVQPSGTDEYGRRTEEGLPMVVVRVGRNLRFEVGYIRYEVAKRYELPPEAVGGIAAGGAVLVLLSLIILAVLRHKNSQAEREYKRIQLQMDTLENSVRSECKQAFAELQTDMTDLTNDLETCGIPTLDHRTYVMKVFFPGVYDHPLLQDSKLRANGMYSTCEMAMGQFEQLLNNKGFLLTFIKTLEVQKSFSFRDRVNVASLLMVILMEKMEYATEVLRALLLQLIEKSVNTKHPQLMLRRTESVVEKMLTNWMALSMYDYLKNEAGSSLFLLFSAIKHQVEKGPVDAITHDARYSLSEERLLREQIDYSIVTVQVVHEDQDEKIVCRVNDCDATSQVKAKLLDAVYKNTPFSLRPSLHDVDLEWRHGRGGHLTLADEDLTTKTINGWRRLNTLKHYGVKDSAVMSLVTKQNDSFSSNCTGNASLNSVSPIVGHYDVEQGLRYWHLVKLQDDQAPLKDYNHKSIPEIFLTRLLSTKGTVQKFVDDFLTTILTANECLPPAVKWLFDLLDEAAATHAILDPEVAHAWKSNSLPLRFWVNFIKNPDFVLDIQKTPVVDSCLSVIAQTLMDACSTSEHRLGKDSPSNKLLFAKDIPTYRKMVNRFYQDVAAMPPVTDQEMCVAMQALSLSHLGEFDIVSALRELYVYAAKYNEQVLEALEMDPYCQKLHLADKLETVACTLEGEETSVC
ncbi:plexin-B-like isoform X4 [Stegodyphus dumicola]|uniref:plexin-B-like isoform X4 n=1 Tax=Stegodyphus dumicola TaxID=202533 RepID=UPI0015AAA606|nr:plexin-B-like isoform X4 [Stegodyphus dumicola]